MNKEDFEELATNTTHIFDILKKGMLFTGKNRNRLFLPTTIDYRYGYDIPCPSDFGYY